MRCTYIKGDGQQCRRKARKGQRYCWAHERPVKADPTLAYQAAGPGPRPETKKSATLASQAAEPKAHPKTSKSAAWHFASLGGPEGLGVVEYGLPDCKDEHLVGKILATPYLQLISCHRNGTILNRFMARPCAAQHHEHFRMGLEGLSSRFPENHFDAGILVGPQSGDIVQAMQHLVKGPIIRL